MINSPSVRSNLVREQPGCSCIDSMDAMGESQKATSSLARGSTTAAAEGEGAKSRTYAGFHGAIGHK